VNVVRGESSQLLPHWLKVAKAVWERVRHTLWPNI
jgi:hypothetical protein